MPMVLKVKEGGRVQVGETIIRYVRRSAGVLRLEIEAPPSLRITHESGDAPVSEPHMVPKTE